MSYTKQVSHQAKKIGKQKFIMTLMKQHLNSDMRTIKKAFSNIKYQNDTDIQSCDTIVLRTLTLTVHCKFFSLMSVQAQNYYYYKKVCSFDHKVVA